MKKLKDLPVVDVYLHSKHDTMNNIGAFAYTYLVEGTSTKGFGSNLYKKTTQPRLEILALTTAEIEIRREIGVDVTLNIYTNQQPIIKNLIYGKKSSNQDLKDKYIAKKIGTVKTIIKVDTKKHISHKPFTRTMARTKYLMENAESHKILIDKRPPTSKAIALF